MLKKLRNINYTSKLYAGNLYLDWFKDIVINLEKKHVIYLGAICLYIF